MPALVIPALVLAMAVGEGTITALGYEGLGVAETPAWAILITAGVASLIVLLPAGLALAFGLKARRGCQPRGLAPALIGAALGVLFIVTNVLGLLAQVETGT